MGLTGRASTMGRFAIAAVLLTLVGLVALMAVRASAAGGPEFLVQFGDANPGAGAGAGETSGPRGVATDPDTGHVYVVENINRRVSEFTAWGEFVKAWGWGVADGTAELQTCTTSCQQGLSGTGAGQFNAGFAQGVAVDSAGDIYVVDRNSRRVQKFNSAGQFLLMFGGEVNKTTGADICTKADLEAANTCGAGTTGAEPGEFGAWPALLSFIAVGPGDTVYVGDNERIQAFNPDGTLQAGSQIALPGAGFVHALAVDPSGNLYVANDPAKVAGVRKLGPSGAVLSHFATDRVPRALATSSAGDLYMVDGTSDPTIRRYDSSGTELASFGEGDFTVSQGIATNPIGNVYVTNGSPGYIRAYGPLPFAYGPPPDVPPDIVSQHAVSVGTTNAIVKAEINPHFFPTTYYVEYGTAACSIPTSTCAQQPVAPGIELATQRERAVPTSDVPLSGLEPGSTYHYRFVAVSESDTVAGPDRTFNTYLPGAFALPDGRAFEMVSPPDKNSGEVAVPGGPGGLVDTGVSVRPLQASVAGESIAYPSLTSFGDAESAPAATTYLSKRGPGGWVTANITPPNEEGATADPFRGFSSDLSFAGVIQRKPKLDPDAVEGFENLYLRDNRDGSVRALTTETPRASGIYCVSFAGASENFDRVIFVATGAATPDSPEAPYPQLNLYEWSAGQLSLVSVLPDGSAAVPSNASGFGAARDGCTMNRGIVHNAISADGSRIFWTYAPPPAPPPAGNTQLLARLNGTDTIQLDAPQGGPDPAGNGEFWAASDDGSKVFFTSPNRLTANAGAAESGSLGDLYLYDFDAASGSKLTDISVNPTPGSDPASVLGVLGASEDGAYVYFVANGVLDEGAVTGEPNLYVWHAGEDPRFIATLSRDDQGIGNNTGLIRFSGSEGIDSSWSRTPHAQTARVSPDGRHVAFLSVASLTGYDNVSQSSGEPVSQVYLYSADDDKLACASCNPSGARPIGFSELPVWITPYEQPRYLSDDGGRLFFLSFDALALGDTNGRQDVYEFERNGVGSCSVESPTFSASSGGCLYRISSGKSSDDAFLLDASSDGRDVFISTRQRLFPADEDERYDVYDARVGGGFPPPPPPPAICAGEACRLAQAGPNVLSPSSSALAGEGNVAHRRPRSRRCPKGKRQVRRQGKARCVKRRGEKRARHNRRAAR